MSESSLPALYLSHLFNRILDNNSAILLGDDCYDNDDRFIVGEGGKPEVCEKMTNAWLQPLTPSWPLLSIAALSATASPKIIANRPNFTEWRSSLLLKYIRTSGVGNGNELAPIIYIPALLAGISYMGVFSMKPRVRDEGSNIRAFRHKVYNYYNATFSIAKLAVSNDNSNAMVRIVVIEKVGRRCFINHLEVVEHLRRTFGNKAIIESHNLATLSSYQQIQMFSRTHILISPFGSASYSSIFLPDFATLIVAPLCELARYGMQCLSYETSVLLHHIPYIHVDLYRIDKPVEGMNIFNRGNGLFDINVSDWTQLDSHVENAIMRISLANSANLSVHNTSHQALSQLGYYADGTLISEDFFRKAKIFIMQNSTLRPLSKKLEGLWNRDWVECVKVHPDKLATIPVGEPWN